MNDDFRHVPLKNHQLAELLVLLSVWLTAREGYERARAENAKPRTLELLAVNENDAALAIFRFVSAQYEEAQ